jgi:hypothetical protein
LSQLITSFVFGGERLQIGAIIDPSYQLQQLRPSLRPEYNYLLLSFCERRMEILFSAKLKKDGKTLQILLLCTECRSELDVMSTPASVRFRCRKHGELGSLSPAQFADGLRQAQEKAAHQYGLGKPLRMKIVPPEPTIQ